MSGTSANDPRPHIQRAAQLLQQGAIGEATAALKAVLAGHPSHADALNLMGVALAQSGDAIAAADVLGRAVQAGPSNPGAHANLGNALKALGRPAEAAESYRRAIALKPDVPATHYRLGAVLLDMQRHGEAIEAFNAAAQLRPEHTAAYLGRARAARALGNMPAALYDIDAALKLNAQDIEALTLRASINRMLNKREEALADYDRGLLVAPDAWDLHNNRGVLLDELGRRDEALAAYERSLQHNPNNPDALQNIGSAYVALNRVDEALAKFEETLKHHPRDAGVLNCKGAVLLATRRHDEAIRAFSDAIAVEPQSAISHFHRSFAYLGLGRFREGFEDYEWRRAGNAPLVPMPTFAQPELGCGESLKGKRILLSSEQGMGDVIQFARFARTFADMGAEVTFATYPALVRLLSSLGAGITVVPPEGPAPAFDVTCPLMSAPHKLGTTLDTVPARVPYLSPPADLRSVWRERLVQAPGGLRVGLAWSGNAQFANDWTRSIAFETMRAILGVPGVTYFIIQKDVRASDEASLAAAGVVDFRLSMNDFADTAAFIDELDLVIAVDTSLAHLAGALAKPVWILLSAISDWRWLEGRSDSPWYPTAQLFRQQTLNDWAPVLADVSAALGELAARRSGQ